MINKDTHFLGFAPIFLKDLSANGEGTGIINHCWHVKGLWAASLGEAVRQFQAWRESTGQLTETNSAVSCRFPAAEVKHWNLWIIVIHTATFSEMTIPTVAVLVLLVLAKLFFTLSETEKIQQVNNLEDFPQT